MEGMFPLPKRNVPPSQHNVTKQKIELNSVGCNFASEQSERNTFRSVQSRFAIYMCVIVYVCHFCPLTFIVGVLNDSYNA